jgi:hypothetical protein
MGATFEDPYRSSKVNKFWRGVSADERHSSSLASDARITIRYLPTRA